MTEQNWPQPYEGVTGIERPEVGDLLSLDDEAMPRRTMMMAATRVLYRACLVGNPAPVVQRIVERMRNPQPGDLVTEMTMQPNGFGFLLLNRREWWETDEEWAKIVEEDPGWAEEGDRRTDYVWYIQYGPDPVDVCRWVNCEFLAVPTTLDFGEPVLAGRREGSATVFTRESLLGSLADSGIQLKAPDQ